MMLASSLATPYVMDPLLETMGLRGVANFVCLGKAIKFRGNCTGGVHFPVTMVIESFLFDVPKSLGKFVFKFGSWVLIDDPVGMGVCQ